MKGKRKLCILTIGLLSWNQSIAQSSEIQLFQKIFNEWTQAFNNKNLSKTCQLFSQNVTANYQSIPTKNYQTICDGFKKIFAAPHIYHYNFKIHNVYKETRLAAVRITWYLTEKENNKIISVIQDEGLDILEKSKQGEWQIINYLGYPVTKLE